MPIRNSLAETVAGRVDRDMPPVMAGKHFSDMLENGPAPISFRAMATAQGRTTPNTVSTMRRSRLAAAGLPNWSNGACRRPENTA